MQQDSLAAKPPSVVVDGVTYYAGGSVVCPVCRVASESIFGEDQDDLNVPTILRVESHSIPVSPFEANILMVLLHRFGSVVTKDRLIFFMYHTGVRRPYAKIEEPENPLNSIRVVLSRLRKKIQHTSLRIKTVNGVGLKMHGCRKDDIFMECA